MEVPIGTGSGVVWDDRGHIITNYHVVRSAKSAQVAILSRKFDDEHDPTADADDDDNDKRQKQLPTSKKEKQASSSTPLSQKPILTTTMRNDAGVTDADNIGLLWLTSPSDGGTPVLDYRIFYALVK